MQALQKQFENSASFAASLDNTGLDFVSDKGGMGVLPATIKEAPSNKLSMQNAFRSANDQQPTPHAAKADSDRNALAGGMLADCLFGACLGLPTVHVGGGIEAGLDMVADVVDEFWTEMRRNKPAAPQPQAMQAPAPFVPHSYANESRKGKKQAMSWENWMAPAFAAPQPRI